MVSEPTNGGLHDKAKIRTIRIFTSHEAAAIAAANLQARGIQSWINSDDGGGMLPNLTAPGGVRLLVQFSDAEAANALLDAPLSTAELSDIFIQSGTEPGVPSPANAAPRKRLAPGQIFVGVVIGVMLCLLYQWNSQRGTKTYYQYTKEGRASEARVYCDGHMIELLRDRNLDGAWDYWVYYDHGQIEYAQYDNNFDGKPDETWTYSNGVLVKMERDTDFNGIPDEVYTYKNGLIQQLDIKPNGAKFATQRCLFQNGVHVETLRGADGSGNFKESVRYDPFENPISTNAVNLQ